MTFDVNNPFIINESFHNKQLNECFIDIKTKNNTIYPLTICDLLLYPKVKIIKISKISDVLKRNNINILHYFL